MRSLACSALIVASLALTGNAAMAANAGIHEVVWPDIDASRITAYAPGPDQRPDGQFGLLFAGTARGGVSAPSASPSYDTSPAIDYSAQQAAQQTIDSVNETMMENSMQATEEQNEAADAATTAGIVAAQQTEIYANSYAANPN
jgi:hypothetical protein